MTMTRLNRPLRRCTTCLLLYVVAVTFTGCAHSNQTPDSIPAKEAAAMTTPESTSKPDMTAEEIGKRFLKLIEGLESRSDLSLDRVQEVLGVPLRHDVDRGLSHYGQVQKNGWRFGVFLYDESPGHKQRVSLQIDQFGESMPSTVCALNFEQYHSALESVGFHGSPVYGEHGQLEHWHYYKPDDLVFQIVPQYAVPKMPGVAGPLCVRSIDMLD